MTSAVVRLRVGALAVCAIALSSAAASGSPLSLARQREILDGAIRAYDQAGALGRSDPAAAKQHYTDAASGFAALVAGGVANASLEYNIGNARFRLGDLGRAVLHYRRALEHAPNHAATLANLRYARDRVEPQVAPSGRSNLVRSLLFWQHGTSPSSRGWACVALSLSGWAVAAAWLRWRRPALAWIGASSVVLGMVSGGSVLIEDRERALRPEAVVVAKTPIRMGRGDGADLALRQPLGPGVELKIIDRRGEWVEVRLASDLTGWVPASSVEAI